jgi:hypothetical protein
MYSLTPVRLGLRLSARAELPLVFPKASVSWLKLAVIRLHRCFIRENTDWRPTPDIGLVSPPLRVSWRTRFSLSVKNDSLRYDEVFSSGLLSVMKRGPHGYSKPNIVGQPLRLVSDG